MISLRFASAKRSRKAVGEHRDVLAAFPQGGHFHADHVEPVVEILTETPFADFLAQVAVGRGDDPHIHDDGRIAAHALDFPLLEGPQKLCLKQEGAVRRFHRGTACRRRPG